MTEQTPTPRTSDIYGILLDQAASRVLLLKRADGDWTLPHIHFPDKCIWQPLIDRVCRELRESLEADITVLRGVLANYAEDRPHVDLVYVLENHTEGWMPPAHARWIDRAELQNLPLAHPEHRTLIDAELQTAETNLVPSLRPPWARPGWFKAASTWIRTQLAERNYTLAGAIEPLKSWGLSCLLRAKTDKGDIFFKVSTALPLFGNEPALLHALALRYPDFVPAPIAIEPTQRWMLMGDFGLELRSIPTSEKWETAVWRFGQLQIQTVSSVDELLAVGCLDRRLNILKAQIDPLMNDEEALSPLSADEIAQLRAVAPRLKAMCDELADYAVPYSLNHGDLHSGNITGETLRFFDWTDACIAHPFFDLSTIINDLDNFPDTREPLVDTYLRAWVGYEPMERLRAMWKLAEPLGALHQAVSYQHILAMLEPTAKQELIWSVPEWLQRVIQTMPN